MNISQVIV